MRRKLRATKFSLKETAYRPLFEQDEEEPVDDTADDAGDDETSEDDLFGDEEGGDDTGEDAGGSFGGDAGGADAEGGDAAAEEPEVEVSPEEEYKLSDSIDQELDALLVDFEEEARKSAVVNVGEEIQESYLIFEEASSDIDLRHFAGNVARFIKNYQNLIDWESVILNKTEMFVNNHYGEETARALFDILEQEYDIQKDTRETEDAPDAPIAVGASNAGGGGL